MNDHLGPTPREIVEELNKYIIGQDEAKRAISIALRNRNRRKLLPKELRDEVIPKNILMIGPTGVGKTEIARRLAMLINAPFTKVEATKFTEIGYVGRSVESMIRDLVNIAFNQVKKEYIEKSRAKIENIVLNKIYYSLIKANKTLGDLSKAEVIEKIKLGLYDELIVEVEVEPIQKQPFMPSSFEEMMESGRFSEMFNVSNPFDFMFGKNKEIKKLSVIEAKKLLFDIESEKIIDNSTIAKKAIAKAEEEGMVFIDEIDKIISKGETSGPNVSREGVQRDLLPIVEGTVVNTRYGPVRTDHILFIAAGAFSKSKPSDLIAELQGRFPVRVELKPLSKNDLRRILTEPKNSLTKQYKAMLETENVTLEFLQETIDYIGEMAFEANSKLEDIGARRLYTIMEQILSDISFNAPELRGQTITITRKYTEEKLSKFIENLDLGNYIL